MGIKLSKDAKIEDQPKNSKNKNSSSKSSSSSGRVSGNTILGQKEDKSKDTSSEQNQDSTLGVIWRGVKELLPSIGKGITSAADDIADSLVSLNYTKDQRNAERSGRYSLMEKAAESKKLYEQVSSKHVLGDTVANWEKEVDKRQADIAADNPTSKVAQYTAKGLELGESVGRMLPSVGLSIATGGATGVAAAGQIAGLGTMALSAYDNSFDRSISEGYDVSSSGKKALGDAMLETGTELLFGGIAGLGKGVVNKATLDTFTKTISKVGTSEAAEQAVKKFGVKSAVLGISRATVKAAEIAETKTVKGLFLRSFGEGAEEMISEALSPFIERATTNPKADYATIEEILEAGVGGALVSFAMAPLGKIETQIDLAKQRKAEEYAAQQEAERLGAVSNWRYNDIESQYSMYEALVFDSEDVRSETDKEIIRSKLGLEETAATQKEGAEQTEQTEQTAKTPLKLQLYSARSRMLASQYEREAREKGSTPEAMTEMWAKATVLVKQDNAILADAKAAKAFNKEVIEQGIANDPRVQALIEEETRAKEEHDANQNLAKSSSRGNEATLDDDTTFRPQTPEENQRMVEAIERSDASAKRVSDARVRREQAEAQVRKEIEAGLTEESIREQYGDEMVEKFRARERFDAVKMGRVIVNGTLMSKAQYENYVAAENSKFSLRKKAPMPTFEELMEQQEQESTKQTENFIAELNAKLAERGYGDKLSVSFAKEGDSRTPGKGRAFCLYKPDGVSEIVFDGTKNIWTPEHARFVFAHEFFHYAWDSAAYNYGRDAQAELYLSVAKMANVIGYDWGKLYSEVDKIYHDYYESLTQDTSALANYITNETCARVMQIAFGSKNILESIALVDHDLMAQMKETVENSVAGEFDSTLWDYERLCVLDRINQAIERPRDPESNAEKIEEDIAKAEEAEKAEAEPSQDDKLIEIYKKYKDTDEYKEYKKLDRKYRRLKYAAQQKELLGLDKQLSKKQEQEQEQELESVEKRLAELAEKNSNLFWALRGEEISIRQRAEKREASRQKKEEGAPSPYFQISTFGEYVELMNERGALLSKGEKNRSAEENERIEKIEEMLTDLETTPDEDNDGALYDMPEQQMTYTPPNIYLVPSPYMQNGLDFDTDVSDYLLAAYRDQRSTPEYAEFKNVVHEYERLFGSIYRAVTDPETGNVDIEEKRKPTEEELNYLAELEALIDELTTEDLNDAMLGNEIYLNRARYRTIEDVLNKHHKGLYARLKQLDEMTYEMEGLSQDERAEYNALMSLLNTDDSNTARWAAVEKNRKGLYTRLKQLEEMRLEMEGLNQDEWAEYNALTELFNTDQPDFDGNITSPYMQDSFDFDTDVAAMDEERLRQYTELQEKYGTQKKSSLPKQINENLGTSELAGRVYKDKKTPKELKERIQSRLLDGAYTHLIITDENALTRVNTKIKEKNSLGEAYTMARDVLKASKGTKDDIVLGEQILIEVRDRISEIQNRNESLPENEQLSTDELYRMFEELLSDLAMAGTRAGQQLQAFSLLKKMTPQGRLYYIDSAVTSLLEEMYSSRGHGFIIDRSGASLVGGYRFQKDSSGNYLKDKNGKKIEIKVSEDLRQRFLNCKTVEEMDALEEEIIADIASQIPPKLIDRVTAWRYLAMLGNPRTHIRNIASNAVMGSIVKAKNKVGAVLEDIILPGETAGRTKTMMTSLNDEQVSELKDFATNDWKNDGMAEQTLNGGKIGFQTRIFQELKTLGFGDVEFLDKLAKWNSNMMEKEDSWAGTRMYKEAFVNYCKAQGLTAEFLNSGTVEANTRLAQARNYSVHETAKAIYRDTSVIAKCLNDIEKSSSVAKIIVGGLMPFKGTPIAILKRGIEYSPIGLVHGFTQVVKRCHLADDVYQGEYSALNSQDAANLNKADSRMSAHEKHVADIADAINMLSAGLTGTGIMLLGLWLGMLGMVKAGGKDNDKEEYYDEMLGNQEYSVTICGTNYTLDWMTPVSMPFFAGATVAQGFNGGSMSFEDIVNGIVNMVDPVTNLSVLQGINDALSVYDGGLTKFATSATESFAAQFVPTIAGQVARSIDPIRRSTYAPKTGDTNVGKNFNTFVNRMENKIPGLSQNNAAYVDMWGRNEENAGGSFIGRLFANSIAPWYTKETNKTVADDYITALFSATDDNSVIPGTVSKNYTFGSETIPLSSTEYQQTQELVGQLRYLGVTSLMEVNGFADLTADEQASIVEEAYDFAREVAKSDYAYTNGISFEEESKTTRIKNAVAAGLSIGEALYIEHVTSGLGADKDKNGNSIAYSKKKKVLNFYNTMGLTQDQIAALWQYKDYKTSR